MASSNELPRVQVDSPEPSGVPFLADATKPSQESVVSTSSKLTSSDKLSALPATSSPPLGRIRTPTPVIRQGADHTDSLPSLISPSPPFGSTDLPPIGHHSLSEGSLGMQTSKQRVSFDSDRGSLSSIKNFRQTLSSPFQRNTHSDPASAPSHTNDPSPLKDLGVDSPSSRSQSGNSRRNSRANSPLRFLQWGFHRGHTREEPFVPVDPFRIRLRLKSLSESARFGSHTSEDGVGHEWCEYDCTEVLPTHCCLPPPAPTMTRMRNFFALAQSFITNIVPHQLYLSVFLLRLPSLYFSRVARIFVDAEVSKPDIQRMIDATTGNLTAGAWAADGGTAIGSGIASGTGVVLGPAGQIIPFPDDWAPPTVSPALARFKNSWEAFIDSLMREWKTQNIVSALLLSAILTLFQIPSAASDPVTRTMAFMSLICALVSLSYGCIYIVRFGTMRSMYKASRWAEEAQRTNTILFWNVWVLLAMPGVFLAWSMLLFVASILSFVWRSGAADDPDPRPPLSTKAALGPRIAITGVFGLGMLYLVLIIRTLRSYGGKRSPQFHWGVWSTGNNEGSVAGPARDGERSGDGNSSRGREQERTPRGNRARRQRNRARDRDHDSRKRREDGERESGTERPPSGLQRVEDDETPNRTPGSPDDMDLEKGGVSEKVIGSDNG